MTPGLSHSFGNKSGFAAKASPILRAASVIHSQISVLHYSPQITLKIKIQTLQYLEISFWTIQNGTSTLVVGLTQTEVFQKRINELNTPTPQFITVNLVETDTDK